MSTFDLVHPAGAVDQFVSELASNAPAAVLLQKEMEPSTSSCTYDATALDTEPVKVALKTLQEKGASSAYEYRHVGRFLFNANSIDNYRASQEIPSVASLSCVNPTPGPLLKFNDYQLVSLQNPGGATYTNKSDAIKITTTGIWRIMLSLGVAFYPRGKVTDDVQFSQVRRAHTNTNFKFLPVNAYLIVKSEAGVKRYVALLATTRISRQEINEDRLKRFGGATTIALTAGETVSIEIQRGGDFGTVVDNSNNTSVKESLGLRKIGDIMTGGDPQQDAYNQLNMVRIA